VKPPSKATLIILILLSMIAWGGSWTSGKVIAGTAAPEVLTFWRFLVTFLSFIPVMLIMKRSLRLNRISLIQVVIGAIFIVSYNKFFFWGLSQGLANVGGVLVTTLNPILTFALAIVLFRRGFSVSDGLGIGLGLSGGLILLEIWHLTFHKLLISGNLFFILASLSWACLSVTSERSRTHVSPLVFSFYVFGLAAVLDFFLAIPHHVLQPLAFDSIFWLNIIFLSVFCTTFATTVYFYASTRLGSHKASSYIFTVPFSAVLISWILLGEIPKTSTIIGGIVAISAVYLINLKPFSFESSDSTKESGFSPTSQPMA
jgi:drug/metabolite transporter (DMT)-like permease